MKLCKTDNYRAKHCTGCLYGCAVMSRCRSLRRCIHANRIIGDSFEYR